MNPPDPVVTQIDPPQVGQVFEGIVLDPRDSVVFCTELYEGDEAAQVRDVGHEGRVAHAQMRQVRQVRQRRDALPKRDAVKLDARRVRREVTRGRVGWRVDVLHCAGAAQEDEDQARDT